MADCNSAAWPVRGVVESAVTETCNGSGVGVGVGSGVGVGVGSGVGVGVGVDVGSGVAVAVGSGAGSTLKLFARGLPQPASLQAWTRTVHSPWSATVMEVFEDSTSMPSFSLLSGPATRQRTQ